LSERQLCWRVKPNKPVYNPLMRYRRTFAPGGAFFFTVVTFAREKILAQEPAILLLRQAFRSVMVLHAFKIEAAVILPDHLHMVWRLPEDDGDYPTRWRLIKSYFTHHWERRDDLAASASRQSKGERTVLQRRYWEHMIRDEVDWKRHVDYIHYNPVKHGLVERVVDWLWSSFHRYVRMGYYAREWGEGVGVEMSGMRCGE